MSERKREECFIFPGGGQGRIAAVERRCKLNGSPKSQEEVRGQGVIFRDLVGLLVGQSKRSPMG